MKFEHKLNEFNNDHIYAICLDSDLQGPELSEKGLYRETYFTVYFSSSKEPDLVGTFKFSPMPGCCGIVISHETYLYPKYRHSFLSNPFRSLKNEIAKKLGYSMMIATTQMDNIPAVQNMVKSDYQICRTFNNKRTNHLLGLGYKVLT